MTNLIYESSQKPDISRSIITKIIRSIWPNVIIENDQDTLDCFFYKDITKNSIIHFLTRYNGNQIMLVVNPKNIDINQLIDSINLYKINSESIFIRINNSERADQVSMDKLDNDLRNYPDT